ncbi:MAG: zinc ribbon domain-containing protein, partial [Acidimicrobiales bacterium]
MSEPEGRVGPACPRCGAESPRGAAFCPYCGGGLPVEPTVAALPPGPTEPSEVTADPVEEPAPHDRAADEAHIEDPDATTRVELPPVPPVGETLGIYAEQKLGRAMHRLRSLAPRGVRVDNRPAGILAIAAGLLTVAATFLTWIQIEINGRSGPGSLATGLAGRDGVTVLVVGALAAAIGVPLLFGRGDGWLKMALFVTGGITTIIAIVDVTDAHSKAEALERRFGIPEGVVTAQVGIGLWLVLATGVAMLAAGVLARRAALVPPAPPAGAGRAPAPPPGGA